MQRLTTRLLIPVFVSALVSPPALAGDETNRETLRAFGDAAVYVIEGGRNPPPDYKYSDTYDRDNAIAKNSALADATYANRILLADWLTADNQRFATDLHNIGRSLEAGRIMLTGPQFELAKRIPLAIPEGESDTCRGVCLDAYHKCTNSNASVITGTMTHS